MLGSGSMRLLPVRFSYTDTNARLGSLMILELLIRVYHPIIRTIVSVMETQRLYSYIRTERLIATTRLNQRLTSPWGRSMQVNVVGRYHPAYLVICKAHFRAPKPQGHRLPFSAVREPCLVVYRGLILAEHNQRLLESILDNNQAVPALLALHRSIQELIAQRLLVPIKIVLPTRQATAIHRRAILAILQRIGHLGRIKIRHIMVQTKH